MAARLRFSEPAWHRRSRRQRTRSRTLLRGAQSGWINPSPSALAQARRRLASHHSASRLVDISPATMAPWQCATCGTHCKATAEYCASCGSHWTHKPYSNQWQRQPAPTRPASPRRYQSPRPRRRGRGKGEHPKGKNEQPKGGKGKQGEAQGDITATRAPALDNLPQPPKAAVIPVPKQTTGQLASSSTSPAEKQLDALIKALRGSKGQIPQEAQQMLDSLQQTQTQQEAKSMHRAVSQQSTAKKEIEKIKTARSL